ncbi:HD-GYP domain-containing protein [uncultured Ruminococcus sp.]|uniref:HD-GYP domain-containing protein n=1 Tax=uncultured Ruminococcus sp. TaxID=165186 RepID=UPI0026007AA1|nr:HD domain-containing phosphohydrolase [uncultured Ruminococcus sp.]
MINIFKTGKSRGHVAVLFCIGGMVLNLILNMAAKVFELPIKLDTVGTVITAVTGGYLPGVLVGFATNLAESISDPSALYYGVFNVLIALFASYLSKRGWLKKIGGIIGIITLFALISGGLGSLIPLLTDSMGSEGSKINAMLYNTGVFNKTTSYITASLILDLLDKFITVVLALIVIRAIPKKIRSYTQLGWWLQSPVSEDELGSVDKSRVLSLRVKVVTVLAVSMASVTIAGIAISMRLYHSTIIRDNTELALGTTKIAANSLDGDRIEEYLSTGGTAEGYRESQETLESILANSEKVSYLYVYQMKEDGFHVVFDVDTEDEAADETGTVIPYGEEFVPYLPQLLAGEEVEPIITDDEYGHLLTAATPVFDSEGKCVCYVIADIDIEQLLADERGFLVEYISLFLGFIILVATIGIWLTQYHVIYPIKSITKFADSFSNEDTSQEKLDDFIRMFRKLDIHTGDEVELLYLTLCSMTLNQAEQTRSIRRLSESTTKMQEGLIITMADLVESRDSDTGAHVQKTAAYVRIIAEGLKRKGYYAEKLTPKFMADVVRSAPLHDVGKINIPDVVLNKPGKLTDEEYAIMKTHTTAGKKIMEHAISTVEGDSYLKEARNMAAYHHERWDGKGYPEGLHGEVIPLSARIMAVADVFDALASPRVYKPAFPLEKALAILEEGKGTQFDPKCVEVFMDSLPQVKEVLRKYQQNV